MEILRRLLAAYPEAVTLLEHESCWQLLIAVILSSRTTDAQVNRVTGPLFGRFPTPGALAEAGQDEVEEMVRSVGFYRVKARHIRGAAATVRDRFGGEVPSSMEELLAIPGLGRKGANVVLGSCFGMPAVIVDTHFGRVVRRTGLTGSENPEAVEREIRALVPRDMQTAFSMAANLHGRAVCTSRAPRCGGCVVREFCRYALSNRS